MKIIAVTGLIGSGKDEAARHIVKKHRFHSIDYSVILGEMLKERGLPPIREEKRKLRRERGNRFLAEEVVKRIQGQHWQKIVLSPIRRPEDYEIPKKAFPELKLLLVQADPRIRFKRVLERERDKPRNWEDFLQEEKKEEEIFHFTKTFTYADYTITNNSSLQELHKEIDKMMKQL